MGKWKVYDNTPKPSVSASFFKSVHDLEDANISANWKQNYLIEYSGSCTLVKIDKETSKTYRTLYSVSDTYSIPGEFRKEDEEEGDK